MFYKIINVLLVSGFLVLQAQADQYQAGVRSRLTFKDLCGNKFLIPRLLLNINFTEWGEFPLAYDGLHAGIDSLACPIQWLYGSQSMRTTSMYRRSDGRCVVVQAPFQITGLQDFYTDAFCSDNRKIIFRGSKGRWPKTDYCQDYVNRLPHLLGADVDANALHHIPRTLGNAAMWKAEESLPTQPGDDLPAAVEASPWELPVGARSYIEMSDLRNFHAPFMKRVKYKTIGQCQLEMRIYKKDIGATNLQPLLFFHPSAWVERGYQFALAEAGVSHFTEAGMVVFMPFYRMVGNASANEECSNVSYKEIYEDSESALQWVESYGQLMGARAGKISVGGISAGAGQAMYLAYSAKRNGSALGEIIDKLALLSPPTSSLDFLRNVQDGGIHAAQPVWDSTLLGYNPQDHQTHNLDFRTKIAIVNHFLGIEAVRVSPQLGFPCKKQDQFHFQQPVKSLLDLTALPEIEETTFPPMVSNNVAHVPPAFIIAGTLDKTVPVRQADLLCQAYGAMDAGDVQFVGTRQTKTIYQCGNGSQYHKISAAGHLFTQRCDRLSRLTPTCNGSVDPHRNESIRTSRQALIDWLVTN